MKNLELLKKLALVSTLVAIAPTNHAAEDNFLYHGLSQDRSSKSAEEALFVEKCGMCHRQAGMGTFLLARRLGKENSMLEERNNLNQEFIKLVVRNGLGNMPRIPRGEVSNKQLEIISSYLSTPDK